MLTNLGRQLAITTIVVIVIGGFYLLNAFEAERGGTASQPTPAPVSQPVSPATAITPAEHWNMYKDEKHGFEIQYPRTWYISKQQDTLFISEKPIPNMRLTHGLTRAIQITIGLSSQEVPNPAWKHSISSVTFDGVVGTRIIDREPNRFDGVMRTTIILRHKTVSYRIIFSNSDSNGSHNPVFDQVLSTIKLTQ